MPTHLHHSALPRAKRLSQVGRALAALQLFKETLTIVLLGAPLLLAQPVLAPAAVPGVVLYLFRWGMMLGQVRRRVAVVIWLFTLVDEAAGLLLYLHVVDNPSVLQMRYLKWSYGLGLALTAAALLEIWWQRSGEMRHLRAQLRTAWR